MIRERGACDRVAAWRTRSWAKHGRGSGRSTFSAAWACSACSRSTSSCSRSPASPAGTRRPTVTSRVSTGGCGSPRRCSPTGSSSRSSPCCSASASSCWRMRPATRAIPAWRTHMRRMAVLLVLGLLHAHLLWYGDMLVPLALSGAVVFFARRLSPGRLLVLGGLAFATASVLSFTLTWSTAQSDPVALAAWRAQWTPRPEIINLEIAQYRGGWLEQMAQRVPAALETETVHFVTRLLWQMIGPHADGHGAVQARSPQCRPLPGLLSAHGEPRVRRRPPVDRARALAELRDGVGPPGLRARQPAAAVLGRSLRGAGLGGPRDAALPARLAASLGGGRGPHGPHQLPHADR